MTLGYDASWIAILRSTQELASWEYKAKPLPYGDDGRRYVPLCLPSPIFFWR